MVQPNGNVIVPFESLKHTIGAFRSTDGGATWGDVTKISHFRFRKVAGDLRTSPLPSAEVDGAGNVFVAWEDCRFEQGCSANDIVFSTSSDGLTWSEVKRVPIDAVGSGTDHFIPGLAVDPATSSSGAHLALTYYFYPDADCTGGCQLEVGYVSSPDGGATWGAPTTLAGPMSLDDIAQTSQGPMVGDYISTSFNDAGNASTVFAVAGARSGTVFHEDMKSPSTPLPVASAAAATRRATSTGAANGVGTGEAQQAVRAR